jgi:hypothetical protein
MKKSKQKARRKKKLTGRRGKYEPKQVVSGSFLDIMKAAGKNANDKSAKK